MYVCDTFGGEGVYSTFCGNARLEVLGSFDQRFFSWFTVRNCKCMTTLHLSKIIIIFTKNLLQDLSSFMEILLKIMYLVT